MAALDDLCALACSLTGAHAAVIVLPEPAPVAVGRAGPVPATLGAPDATVASTPIIGDGGEVAGYLLVVAPPGVTFSAAERSTLAHLGAGAAVQVACYSGELLAAAATSELC